MSDPLQPMIAAGHWPERVALAGLLAVARRPRGAALLARVPPLAQAASSLLAMARYDDPAIARRLGWDADAVARRGRALRLSEGRP
jgi:hypothetical protein